MPDNPDTINPRVFISYSHDSEGHRERVLRLAERLRPDGYEAMLDRYVQGTPPQGWERWMLNEIEAATYVLVVCTETYYRRFRGKEPGAAGRGVNWEGAIIMRELYDSKSNSVRFVPILFCKEDSSHIPEPLRSATYYVLNCDDSYTELTDFLAGVAGVEPAPLGPPPQRKRKTGAPLRFNDGDPAATDRNPGSSGLPSPATLCAPGGAMSTEHAFYIERDEDRNAHAAALRYCETLVIKGPCQFGKSSLLARYVAWCRANGKTVASVNFGTFEDATICDYSRLLTAVATQLARSLGYQTGVDTLETQQEFVAFLEYTLLPGLAGPVVFAIDQTDRIMRQAYAEDFFAMVRMWHDMRADPFLAWHKVGLALVSSYEPKLYIRDPLRSPFNVGERLRLKPFTLSEVVDLNRRYGAPLSIAECEELHRLVGGHPFLTQEAYYRLICPNSLSFATLCGNAPDDDGPFRDHLHAMLANVGAAKGLLDALRQAIALGTVPHEWDYYRLAGAGLVVREHGRIVPTNEIYAGYFRCVI